MKITANERIALNMIARNLYQPANGGYPETFEDTSSIWSMCIDDCHVPERLTGRTLSGACASLAKKGLVAAYNYKPANDSTIELTEAGYVAWKAAYPMEA